jgi:hypothetical protein
MPIFDKGDIVSWGPGNRYRGVVKATRPDGSVVVVEHEILGRKSEWLLDAVALRLAKADAGR